MVSRVEDLRLDIAIARLAAEYARTRDAGRKAQLLGSIQTLTEQRDDGPRVKTAAPPPRPSFMELSRTRNVD